MYCNQCGERTEPGQPCPKCGAVNNAPAGTPGQQTEALQQNTAGILCYLLGWITGIIFLIIDKRPFVRFHAAQSIITFGALAVLNFVLSRILMVFPLVLWSLFSIINTVIGIGSIVLAIFLMLQAHKGIWYSLPFVGPYAKKLAEKKF